MRRISKDFGYREVNLNVGQRDPRMPLSVGSITVRRAEARHSQTQLALRIHDPARLDKIADLQ